MTIDVWTLALQTVNLLVLMALLRWLLLKPLLATLDARRAAVDAERRAAHEATAQARQQAEALAAERASLATQAASLQASARAEAEALREAARQQASADAATLLEAGRTRLADERRAASGALRDSAATLATTLAARLLQALPGDGSDSACADALLQRLRALPEAARRDWLGLARQAPPLDAAEGPGAGPGPALTLATAAPLPEAEAQRQTAELRALCGDTIALACVADPALLRGAELRAAHGVLALHWAAELADARQTLATVEAA